MATAVRRPVSLREVMDEEYARKLMEDDLRAYGHEPGVGAPALGGTEHSERDCVSAGVGTDAEAEAVTAEDVDEDLKLAMALQAAEDAAAAEQSAQPRRAAWTSNAAASRDWYSAGFTRSYDYDSVRGRDGHDGDADAAVAAESELHGGRSYSYDDDEEQSGLGEYSHNGHAGTGVGWNRQGVGSGRGRGRGRGAGLMAASDGSVISKHDATVCGRRNARDIERRSGGEAVMPREQVIPTKAYNSLRRFFDAQTKKGMKSTGRVDAEYFATRDGVLDRSTRAILFKLENAGRLHEVHGVVRTGKEANVYHATGWTDAPETVVWGDSDADDDHADVDRGEVELAGEADGADLDAAGLDTVAPADGDVSVEHGGGSGGQDVAIKVFRTTLATFKNRVEYIAGDHRFADVANLARQNPRTIVTRWAEKEMKNLCRIHRAGIPCPEPLCLRSHVLIMSFIGKDGWPAPQLREASLSASQVRSAYKQTVTLMHRLYHECALVHADLSEYNLLWHRGTVHVIDVGQAVVVTAPSAAGFLDADCRNVTRFFASKGARVVSETDLAALVRDASLSAAGAESDEEAACSDEEAAEAGAGSAVSMQGARDAPRATGAPLDVAACVHRRLKQLLGASRGPGREDADQAASDAHAATRAEVAETAAAVAPDVGGASGEPESKAAGDTCATAGARDRDGEAEGDSRLPAADEEGAAGVGALSPTPAAGPAPPTDLDAPF